MLAGKLAEKCTENIEETRLVEITIAKNENKHKCSSCTKQFNEVINGKSQTNRDQKSNLSFLQRCDQSQQFRIKLVENRLIYYIGYIKIKKNWRL